MISLFSLLTGTAPHGLAAEAATTSASREFAIPAGDATTSLREFSEQAELDLLYSTTAVAGVATPPVQGHLTADDALAQLLRDTPLRAQRHPVTGGYTVTRVPAAANESAPPPAVRAGVTTAQTGSETSSATVKQHSPLTLLRAFLGLAVAAPAAGAAVAESGTVEGRVFNAATGNALANARVSIAGSNREAITDEAGGYRLSGVSAGAIRLEVFYVGMERETASVQVPVGGRVQREFELRLAGAERPRLPSEVVKLDAFTVVADREMSAQAIAMNEQRHAPNLRNVVAIDEFGDRGNENIGDFLLFLPGVSIVLSGLEPFEVSLRGLPSNTSALMIDGGEMASTRDERSPNLRAVPMSNLSRVEVTKVPTPDYPANGLGGTINLISKTGLEAKRPVFSYQLYGLFHDSTGLTLKAGPHQHLPQNTFKWKQPSWDFNYSHPVNKSLAITVGGARTWRMVPMESGNDENATWDFVNLFQRISQWTTLVQLNKTLSGQVGLDWRIGPADTLSLSYHQRSYELPISRSTMIVTYGAGATGGANFTQGAATGVGTIQQGQNWRVEGYLTEQFSARYRHRGSVWRLDAGGSWSESGHFENDVEEGTFRNTLSVLSNVVIRGEGPPVPGGIMHTRFSAVSRTGQPLDVYNGALYSIPSATSAQLRRKGDVLNGRIDLARDFGTRVPTTLKVGAAVNRKTSDVRTYNLTWNFRPNGASDVNSRLAGNFPVFDEAFLANGPTVFGVPYREISQVKLYDLYRERPEWFVLDEALAYQNQVTGSREYTETISAAYLRADARFFDSRLWLVGGVRFERTDGKGSGPLDDINAQYQRDAAGNFIRNAAGQRVLITSDPLAQRQLRYRERASRASRSYDDFYPSLNAAYNLSDHLLVRAAYARTIGRPSVNFITPGVTITAPEVASPTITVSNVGLLPWTAHNYDLTLESYNFKDGFGSIGVFQKDIKNFFGSRRMAATPELLALYGVADDGSYGNYEIATRENVGDARITGMEFGYRQSLTFLPHWARGLQVYVNYTKLELSGSSAAEFTGFNPSTMSGGVNFVRGRYFIKASYSYQGETRRALQAVSVANGIPPDTYEYQAKQSRLNLSGEFSLTRRLSIFATVMDVGGFDFRALRYAPNTPDYAKGRRLMRMGSFTTLGVKGRF